MSYDPAKAVTMAQLCLDSSTIVHKDVHEIHIFKDASSANLAGNEPVNLTVARFNELFYGGDPSGTTVPNGETKFGAYAVSTADEYNLQKDKQYRQWQSTDTSGVNFVAEVIELWGGDKRLKGSQIDPGCQEFPEWSTCSLMAIRKELIDAHNFYALANCNVCCSLKYGDLLKALQQVQGVVDDTKAVGASGGKDSVESGDQIALSILLKQAAEGRKDVEVTIHYEITA